MDHYTLQVLDELNQWKWKMKKKASIVNRFSKNVQNKVNSMIPDKVHNVMTESIRKMVEATLVGSNLTTYKRNTEQLTFEETEKLVREKLQVYKRTAALEGAGTGAGGILLGMADFPLFLSIKMKFLFDVASLYGFDVKSYEERLFILFIFQLAFSSEDHRITVFEILENWNEKKNEYKYVDWRTFQQEYRDYIDLIKMLQLVPGIGAVVGAYANYQLLDHLGETAMNVYRMRVLV